MNEQVLSLEGRLERLVDGELTPEEYRALLASLEEEPGGWRRCALVFLESQALRQELWQVRRSLDVRGAAAESRDVEPRSLRQWDKVRTLLAIAASFVVALALGLAAPGLLRLVQENFAGGNINPQRPALVVQDNSAAGPVDDSVRYVGDVRVLVDDSTDGTQAAGHVPVYEVGSDVTRYLAGEPPVLGPAMIELLRQHGYDVRHDQQYFPAPLEDGREIIVPVEGYQITPVSRRY